MFRKPVQHCAPHISFSSPFNSINRFVCWDVLQWAPPQRYFKIEMTSPGRDNHLHECVVLLIEPIQQDYLCIQGNKASHQSRYFPLFQLCAIRKLFHQQEVAWTFYFNSFFHNELLQCTFALLKVHEQWNIISVSVDMIEYRQTIIDL